MNDRLSARVAAVDAEFGAGHVARSLAAEESDWAHEVGWAAHFTLGDERGPLLG